MLANEDLKAAVAQGILDLPQAERLEKFLRARPGQAVTRQYDTEATETESVRFVRGFHDIFLALGLVLLFLGLRFAGAAIDQVAPTHIIAALAAWGLAEFLVVRRRLVLPGIILAIAFVYFSATTAGYLVTGDLVGLPDLIRNSFGIWYAGVALLAAAVYFYRFRLPFALALVAGAAIILFLAIFSTVAPQFFSSNFTLLVLLCGLVTFAAAMCFDLSDPQRKTLQADNAFWMHLLAAPLLVHSILGQLAFGKNNADAVTGAIIVVAVVLSLAFIALLADRRALLVAGLSYLGVAIASLIRETELETGTVTAVTLILLGAAVVALGSGWQSARSVLLRILPLPAAIRGRLPPVRGQA